MTRTAWGAGFSTEARDGTVLDAWFRWLGWGELGEEAPEEVDVALAGGERRDALRRVTIRPLRLHLLSHRYAAPRSLNVDGVFGRLDTVAWTDLGPVLPADLDDVRLAARA